MTAQKDSYGMTEEAHEETTTPLSPELYDKVNKGDNHCCCRCPMNNLNKRNVDVNYNHVVGLGFLKELFPL
ncbi:unnamed protein product [Enterobius vermicularis]|uniref:Uncharacterized protein n=1 Tax=Enterobius vermicularis TaxID=51028 RepID=A0A0N4VDH4_ENTVE|nr:unnamed protein product [Enterobius vermicularis]